MWRSVAGHIPLSCLRPCLCALAPAWLSRHHGCVNGSCVWCVKTLWEHCWCQVQLIAGVMIYWCVHPGQTAGQTVALSVRSCRGGCGLRQQVCHTLHCAEYDTVAQQLSVVHHLHSNCLARQGVVSCFALAPQFGAEMVAHMAACGLHAPPNRLHAVCKIVNAPVVLLVLPALGGL